MNSLLLKSFAWFYEVINICERYSSVRTIYSRRSVLHTVWHAATTPHNIKFPKQIRARAPAWPKSRWSTQCQEYPSAGSGAFGWRWRFSNLSPLLSSFTSITASRYPVAFKSSVDLVSCKFTKTRVKFTANNKNSANLFDDVWALHNDSGCGPNNPVIVHHSVEWQNHKIWKTTGRSNGSRSGYEKNIRVGHEMRKLAAADSYWWITIDDVMIFLSLINSARLGSCSLSINMSETVIRQVCHFLLSLFRMFHLWFR